MAPEGVTWMARASETLCDHVLFFAPRGRHTLSTPPPEQPQEEETPTPRVNLFHQPIQTTCALAASPLAHAWTQPSHEGLRAAVYVSTEDVLPFLPVLFSLRSVPRSVVVHVYHENQTLASAVGWGSLVDVGMAMLVASASPQEIEDLSVIVQLTSLLSGQALLHCSAGPALLPSSSSPLSRSSLASLMETLEISSSAPTSQEDPKSEEDQTGEEGSNAPVVSSSPLYQSTWSPRGQEQLQQIPDTMQRVMEAFAQQEKRTYNLYERIGGDDASLLVVIQGCSRDVLQAAWAQLPQPQQVAVILVRLLRPWDEERFQALIPSRVQHVAVWENESSASSRPFPPLHHDVVASLSTQETWQEVRTSYHRPTHPFQWPEDALATLVAQYQAGTLRTEDEPHEETLSAFSGETLEENEVVASPQEYAREQQLMRPYQLMIEQVAGGAEAVEILTPAHTTSAEWALGVCLARENQRQQLRQRVEEMLQADPSSSSLPPTMRQALTAWLASPTNGTKIEQTWHDLSTEEKEQEDMQFLLSQQAVWAPKSYWIVGHEQWTYDIMASGLHTLLASGRNINLVVVNSSLLESHSGSRRKDMGLYAMNYGGAYVAGVAPFANYSQTLRALYEGQAFAGPSILLAYSPLPPVDSIPSAPTHVPLYTLQQAKRAVDQGTWPLYRYDPHRTGATLELDCTRLKREMEDFLKRENQLAQFSRAQAAFQPLLAQSHVASERHNQHTQLLASYQTLLQQMQAPARSLLLLFGSDGGRAEEAAQRIAQDAGLFQYAARVLPMNDVSTWEQVAEEEELIVFVVSTAGQGEFPANSKEAWKQLESLEAPTLFQHVSYAVFALGDSHYWPKPEEQVYFCKPGRDLDRRLDELGGRRLVALGLGDDQDADGWESGYEGWRDSFWTSVGADISRLPGAKTPVASDNDIKAQSNFLRGTIAEGLEDRSTAALSYENTKLTKFHGIYQQDDRDLREARRQAGQEKAFSFMVRIRAPAGVCTPAQWKMFDQLASTYGNETFKLTTRQAVQLHGILKWDLKASIQTINRELMDTLAACGDVNRNVMCNPNPQQSHVFEQVHQIAAAISEHLTPRTSAYHEIWLDKKKVAGDEIGDIEPLYGPTYLPRKFKVAMTVPPENDVDVLAHCLGYIAILEGDRLVGFNVTVGGGMGMTHNNTKTYPRLADPLGFCTPEQAVAVSEAVLLVQRDHGDRTNRKHARLKYTVEDHGVAWFREQVEAHLGFALGESRPYQFTSNGDRFGWKQGVGDRWHYTLFVENGRVRDVPGLPIRTALRELAEIHTGDYRITANQNLIITNITEAQKPQVQALLDRYHLDNRYSAMRLNSMACVALPTCGLALAESERYLPVLVDKLEEVIDRVGLRHDAITIRMSGCPNGCSRPYVAEIALVGRAPGIYNLYLGGGFAAERLCKLYQEGVNENQILEALTPLLERYAQERLAEEKFGEFVIRQGVVRATLSGNTFHER